MKKNELTIKIVNWTVPCFGNDHIMPYGKLQVSDGNTTKIVKTKGDKFTDSEGYQYITFLRKRYKLINVGRLYSPIIKLELI